MLWIRLLCLIFILLKVKAKIKTIRNGKYCKLPWNDGSQNIACEYTEKIIGECYDVQNKEYYFNKTDKRNIIVSRYNEFRNKVAGGEFEGLPTSALMYRFIWDEELAFMARIKLRFCTLKGDNCSATRRFDDPGYKVIIKTYQKPDFKKKDLETILNETVDATWSLKDKILPHEIKKYRERYKNKTEPVSRFMLLIIGRSTHIGCAALTYRMAEKIFFRMLCYYSYKNIQGCPVYKIGTPGSKCPYGKDKKYPNLSISF